MKTELSKIAKDLEKGTITETEARTLLLGLLGVRLSFISDEQIKSEALQRAKKTNDKVSGLEVKRLEGMGYWVRFMIQKLNEA